MKTEELLAALAADPVPGPGPAARALRAVPVAAAAIVAAVWAALGFRPTILSDLPDPLSTLRFGLTLALFAAAGAIALRLSRPDARAGWPALALAAIPAVAAALWTWALLTTPPGGLGMAIQGKTLVTCLVSVPALSVLSSGAILWSLRQGAPTAPRLTGFLAGLAGGGLAAAAYALHCTETNPLFYVTWYGTGILVSGAAGALIGPRLLRW